MHDIDSTTAAYEPETEYYGTDEYEYEEEFDVYGTGDTEYVFSEQEEMALADELLSVYDDEELEQFLGKVFKKASKGIRKIGQAAKKVARPLGGMIKGMAKQALPAIGGALGSMIPVPGVGTALGTAVGSAVGNALEMEFEGMESDDLEFEKARRLVRIAGQAAKQAASGRHRGDPQAVAKKILVSAAKKHVPSIAGAIRGAISHETGSAERSGRWIRRGRDIILLGV